MREEVPAEGARVEAVIPHGPSFRFVDRVTHFDKGRTIQAELRLSPDAPYFAGHFPGRPLMPGVLITEALAQASGLLLGLTQEDEPAVKDAPSPHFFLAATQMKFARPVPPGVTLRLFAELERDFGKLFRCRVEARVGEELVASGHVTLASENERGPLPVGERLCPEGGA